jgi:hypothetical protein
MCTLTPDDAREDAKEHSNISPEVLVSRAMTAFFALDTAARAHPILAARIGVSSTLARPRTPELPNNFAKLSRLFGTLVLYVIKNVCVL